MLISKELFNKINKLKKEKNAIILAHLYQNPEIQELADFTGDSLDLSLKAKNTDATLIIFCGVKFMAETAKLISPEKRVILAEEHAGCPMADMITLNDIKKIKEENPKVVIVTYVNSTAEIKAYSDICCTSRNAVKIIESIDANKDIYFVPDMNLGNYLRKITKRQNIKLWPGYCNVHTKITVNDVIKLKQQHPYAKVLAHPECREEVLNFADYILSTAQMLDFAKDGEEFIILTEAGILYQLQKKYPNKAFYTLSKAICPNMKKTRVESIINSFTNLEFEINLSDDIIQKARNSVLKMLEIK